MLTGQTSCGIRHQHLLAISLASVAPSPHLQLSHTTDSLKTADLNCQSLNCNWMQRSISNITRISEYSGSTQGISCDINFPKNQPDITWGQNPRRKHHNSTETFLVNSPDMSWNSPISHSLQLQTPPPPATSFPLAFWPLFPPDCLQLVSASVSLHLTDSSNLTDWDTHRGSRCLCVGKHSEGKPLKRLQIFTITWSALCVELVSPKCLVFIWNFKKARSTARWYSIFTQWYSTFLA